MRFHAVDGCGELGIFRKSSASSSNCHWKCLDKVHDNWMSAVDDFQNSFAQIDRAGWMAVLARATREELQQLAQGIALPRVDVVKPPECGSLMIEARAGGGGRRRHVDQHHALRDPAA